MIYTYLFKIYDLLYIIIIIIIILKEIVITYLIFEHMIITNDFSL